MIYSFPSLVSGRVREGSLSKANSREGRGPRATGVDHKPILWNDVTAQSMIYTGPEKLNNCLCLGVQYCASGSCGHRAHVVGRRADPLTGTPIANGVLDRRGASCCSSSPPCPSCPRRRHGGPSTPPHPLQPQPRLRLGTKNVPFLQCPLALKTSRFSIARDRPGRDWDTAAEGPGQVRRLRRGHPHPVKGPGTDRKVAA